MKKIGALKHLEHMEDCNREPNLSDFRGPFLERPAINHRLFQIGNFFTFIPL